MGVGRTNKRKGNDAEKYYSNLFIEMGFTSCVSSKTVSKKHDNAKIDLMEVPFNIQVKAGKQSGMNPGKELFVMDNSIKLMFSPDDEVFSKPNILFHYMEGPGLRSKKREPEHEMCYMSLKQFELFKTMNPDLKFSYSKTFKFDLDSEYRDIVGMTVETFRKEIILKHYNNGISSSKTGGN